MLSLLDNVASDVVNIGDVISEQQQQMNCECGRGKEMSIIELSSAAERTQIIDWLSPINFFFRQADISRARLAGTGGWLLDHPSFQEWKSGSGKTLWCRGMRAWPFPGLCLTKQFQFYGSGCGENHPCVRTFFSLFCVH
jgi:hypothetical protein